MRILHTSDWHLGKFLYGRSLLEDQVHFINTCFFPVIEQEKPDAIVIAGDIFDRQIAPADAIRLFDEVVSRICAQYRIPLIVATGNHDGADRFSLGAGLLRLGGFHLTTKLKLNAQPVVLTDEHGPVHIYALPWLEPAMVREAMEDDSLRGFQDAYAAVTSHLRLRQSTGARNLLVAHCFVTGSQTSESESTLFVGGGGDVSSRVFEGFDYVALGHLHAPQRAGENIRYSGSPLKYSFDEERQRKSMTMVELGKKELSVREIPVTPLREMRTLTGTIEQVEQLAQAYGGDYVYVNLLGPPIFEPMARLRKSFPYILGLTNGSQQAGSDLRGVMRNQLRKRDDRFIFEQFILQMCADAPNDDDRAVFNQARECAEQEETR